MRIVSVNSDKYYMSKDEMVCLEIGPFYRWKHKVFSASDIIKMYDAGEIDSEVVYNLVEVEYSHEQKKWKRDYSLKHLYDFPTKGVPDMLRPVVAGRSDIYHSQRYTLPNNIKMKGCF